MTPHRPAKTFLQTTLMLAPFPMLLLAGFYGYVLEVRLRLGHWPSYGQPDPKDLGWWGQQGCLQLGFVAWPVIALFAFGLAIFGRVRSREFPLLSCVGMIIFSSVALVTIARMDPGGFVDWFWD